MESRSLTGSNPGKRWYQLLWYSANMRVPVRVSIPQTLAWAEVGKLFTMRCLIQLSCNVGQRGSGKTNVVHLKLRDLDYHCSFNDVGSIERC